MASIFQRALGDEFCRLHPQLQALFGFSSSSDVACCGRGVMEVVKPGLPHVKPFLWLGSLRRIMFPHSGTNVPFVVHNYCYVDSFGRETLTWLRTFELSQARQFDEYMIFSEKRGCIVVYAGSHQHLAVELRASVEHDGSMRMRTGAQRLYEWRVPIRFPRVFSADGDIRVWFDDARNDFGINVDVANRYFGKVFHYRGRFVIEWTPCAACDVPIDVRPLREERRE